MSQPPDTRMTAADTQSAKLWGRVRDGGREAHLAGDTHTHPGRFLIQCVGDADQRRCSLYELSELSSEAALWLSGYLHGAVPRRPDDEDELAMQEWTEKRAIFLRSGAWPGRSDYTDYRDYGYAFSIGTEVRVQPRPGADPELEQARDHLGVIDSPVVGDGDLQYAVTLDAEGEVWTIAEPDLVATGARRQDYRPDPRFACPCCGFLTLQSEHRGSYEICKVCFWEDDEVQLRDPDYAGGANTVSLNQARETFAQAHVSEIRFADKVRRPAAWEYPPPKIVTADGATAGTWPLP